LRLLRLNGELRLPDLFLNAPIQPPEFAGQFLQPLRAALIRLPVRQTPERLEFGFQHLELIQRVLRRHAGRRRAELFPQPRQMSRHFADLHC
jgi:hypothetical protein